MRSSRAFRLKVKRRFKERLRWYKRGLFLFLFSLFCAVWSLFQWNAEGPLTALSDMFLPLVAWVPVAARLLIPRRDYW